MSITRIRLDDQSQDATLTPAKVSTTVTDDFTFPRDVIANAKVQSDKVTGRTGDLILQPFSNSTTGVKLTKADGTTIVLDVDTTNSRIGIGTSTPSTLLHVAGDAQVDSNLNSGSVTTGSETVTSGAGFSPSVSLTLTSSTVIGNGTPRYAGGLTLTTANIVSAGAGGKIVGGDITLTTGEDTGFGAGNESGGNIVLTSFTPSKGGSIVLTGTGSNGTPGSPEDGNIYSNYTNASTAVVTPLVQGTSPLQLRPGTDSTGAILLQNAAGSTTTLDVDTTNSRVGIGNSAPATTLDVTGTATVSVKVITPQLDVVGGNKAIDLSAGTGRSLLTSGGVFVVDWQNLLLATSGGTSVDWGNRRLRGSTGGLRADWQVQSLYDSGAIASLDWTARTLKDTAGTTNLTWATPGVLDVNSNRITNLADPTAAQDAVTKTYADSVASGLDPKESSKTATTAAGGNIAGYATSPNNGTFTIVVDSNTNYFPTDLAGIKVDGVTLAVNDRVVVKDQTDAKQNGIYKVTAIGNRDDGGTDTNATLTRAPDQDGTPANEVSGGNFTFVEAGTLNADTGWVVSADGVLTLNTDSIPWTQFSQAGVILAGAGLLKTGTTIDVQTADDSMTINADSIQVKRDAAGAIGLTASGIKANTDGTSLEISSNALRIASGAAGTGLGYSAGVLSVNLLSTGGLEFSSDDIQIKTDTTTANTIGVTHVANGAGVKFDSASFEDSGSETLALTAGVAGSGLALTTGVLSVNVDDSTIEINSDTLRVKALGITNAHISATAAIDATKIADGSVTSTEFQYINTLTSNAQTQLNGKASTALDNLAAVAINTTLVSDTDNTDDLGTAAINWKDVHAKKLISSTAVTITASSGNVVLDPSGSNVVDVSTSKITNVVDPTAAQDAATKAYVDALLAAHLVTREVPSGTINGTNPTFTLAFTPVVGSETLFLNGLLQNAGAGNDYTISGATITFEAGAIPETGSVLLACYRK